MPGWLLPLAFLALLIYHLHDHSKLSGQVALEAHAHGQTAKKLTESIRDLAAAQNEIAEQTKKFELINTVVREYLEGATTDEEFWASMETFFVPIEDPIHRDAY